ncbi:MAG: hypothetical protein K1X92_17895 [Bacteroidia bacterium]|nr:hypothetical protein [Bacteroidia bacterium]
MTGKGGPFPDDQSQLPTPPKIPAEIVDSAKLMTGKGGQPFPVTQSPLPAPPKIPAEIVASAKLMTGKGGRPPG